MQSDNNIAISSRSELIRRARESCTINLSSSQGKRINTKERKLEMEDSPYRKKTVYREATSTSDTKIISKKLFMVRFVCAIILFLFVVAVDQLNLNYNNMDSDTIKNSICSNDSITKAVDYVSNFASSFMSKIN